MLLVVALVYLILLFLILIINTYSRTDRFYTHCKSGAPNSGLLTYSDCRNYAQEGTHCCLLYYVANPDIQYNYNFKKTNANNKALLFLKNFILPSFLFKR